MLVITFGISNDGDVFSAEDRFELAAMIMVGANSGRELGQGRHFGLARPAPELEAALSLVPDPPPAKSSELAG